MQAARGAGETGRKRASTRGRPGKRATISVERAMLAVALGLQPGARGRGRGRGRGRVAGAGAGAMSSASSLSSSCRRRE
ncbi:hypothetical protein BS50DRAFT_304432 [Corynespora cassiicola Philippines]|uniref:Uncharacterized protein n=1 Tax=Corynespora cassiicola Philippines TaxID=1448308 RepID=A0A2T2NXC7_CORCC|nr:hypothetical protein BS50DRAFT_304432 [Corynespora cassiicola Philippines]